MAYPYTIHMEREHQLCVEKSERKKVSSRMYCMRKLRSLRVNSDMLVTFFYNAVICSSIMFGSVCWGGNISKLDRGKLEKIVKKKSRSCCGKATGQF